MRRPGAARRVALGLIPVVAWLGAGGRLTKPVSAADYCVSSSGTIQNAVNAAGDGYKVLALATTYQGNLVITGDMVVQGGWDNGSNTSVTRDPMNIQIANKTIAGDVTGSGAAIDLGSVGTDEAKVTNNIVVSHTLASGTMPVRLRLW